MLTPIGATFEPPEDSRLVTPRTAQELSAELLRLGLLPSRPRAVPSDATIADALLEAFGNDRWRTLPEATVVVRLRQATWPPTLRDKRRPRYAAMGAGGVVECVIGLGFDDAVDDPRHASRPSGANRLSTLARVSSLSEALRSRGYVEGRAAAEPLLAELGRQANENGTTKYFSRANTVRLASVAGGTTIGSVVVRLVANTDGCSGDAAGLSFRDGLNNAAICAYVGHWRYGLGPDFDCAFGFEVLDTGDLPGDPARLAAAAAVEAERHSQPIEATLDRWRDEGRIRITRSNAARVSVGGSNPQPRNATARLVHWIAAGAARGPEADLTAIAVRNRGPRHRLWMLISCRSAAIFPTIRRTVDASALRLVGLRGTASLDNWRTLPWILDALCAGGTWPELIGAIDTRRDPDGVVIDGWEADPCFP